MPALADTSAVRSGVGSTADSALAQKDRDQDQDQDDQEQEDQDQDDDGGDFGGDDTDSA